MILNHSLIREKMMPNQIMIPALPCRSIQETLNFYVAMGFEITYQQTRPNIYGCVKYENIELHFFTLKDYEPANSYSTCLVLIEDADALHKIFAANLRQQYAKLPIAGIPRITKPNNHNAAGDYRFNVVDPGGNWIRFIQRNSQAAAASDEKTSLTRMGRAIKSATLLTHAKGDFDAAAKILDTAMNQNHPEITPLEQIQALFLRAEIAINMDDAVLAHELLEKINNTSPANDAMTQVMQQAQELAQLLG